MAHAIIPDLVVYPSAWVTSLDFNGTARTGTPDAGAYTWTGSTNPAWVVTEGFKTAPSGTVPAAPTGLRPQ